MKKIFFLFVFIVFICFRAFSMHSAESLDILVVQQLEKAIKKVFLLGIDSGAAGSWYAENLDTSFTPYYKKYSREVACALTNVCCQGKGKEAVAIHSVWSKLLAGNNAKKRTLLHIAVRANCSIDFVKLLVKMGADVHQKDAKGRVARKGAVLSLNGIAVESFLQEIERVTFERIYFDVHGNAIEQHGYTVPTGQETIISQKILNVSCNSI